MKILDAPAPRGGSVAKRIVHGKIRIRSICEPGVFTGVQFCGYRRGCEANGLPDLWAVSLRHAPTKTMICGARGQTAPTLLRPPPVSCRASWSIGFERRVTTHGLGRDTRQRYGVAGVRARSTQSAGRHSGNTAVHRDRGPARLSVPRGNLTRSLTPQSKTVRSRTPDGVPTDPSI